MKQVQGVFVALVAMASFAAIAHAQEIARDVRSTARVFATAGVAGRFGEARCVGDTTVVPHDAAAFTGPLVSRSAGSDTPLVVDTGGLLAPHGVARFAARDLPNTLADLVAGLGYDVLAFGENDVGAPRPRTIELARVLSSRTSRATSAATRTRRAPRCVEPSSTRATLRR